MKNDLAQRRGDGIEIHTIFSRGTIKNTNSIAIHRKRRSAAEHVSASLREEKIDKCPFHLNPRP
jgi:hypothetical protein